MPAACGKKACSVQLGVQTYTIREAARRNLPEALARLKALGVTSVELARIAFSPENAAIVRASGLAVMSIQATYKELSGGFDGMAAFCAALDCKLVVVSVLPLACILGGERPLRAFAAGLDGLAARYREQGIALAFHHHDFEFKRLGGHGAGAYGVASGDASGGDASSGGASGDGGFSGGASGGASGDGGFSSGRSKFELLVELCSPSVKFVLDTYWAKRSGEDPCRLIAWLGERLAGLHLRDHALIASGARLMHRDTELGRGDIDFAAVIKAASPYASYAAIEQKSDAPFESLALSLEQLKRLGFFGARLDAAKDARQDAGKDVPWR
jgi:sugar phosphate isomerase/epimerase